MSSYTSNYQLHQWEPSDNFLRTDFNADFAKIDAAIKGVETTALAAVQETETTALTAVQTLSTQAAQERQSILAKANRALAGLEQQGYNLYNLMLQQYYESKADGYRKALLFDGFQNGSRIASASTGVGWYAPGPYLLLDAMGQQTYSYGYGTGRSYTMLNGQATEVPWVATGNGILTSASLYLTGEGTLSICQGATALQTVSFSSGSKPFSVALNVEVKAGVSYGIKATCVGTTTMNLYSDRTVSFGFGHQLTFTPKRVTSGNIVSTAYASTISAQRAVAWVRHSAGTVGMSVRQGTAAWSALTKTGTRSTVTAQGTACTESAFALDKALSGNLQIQLNLSTTGTTSVKVFDYGMILL